MAQAIVMPKLGQTVEEATIVIWHKKEGDAVKKGDILFEIETDKAVLEAESFHDGTLIKILVPEKVPVPVSSTVAFIGEPGESVPDIETPKPQAEVQAAAPTAAPRQQVQQPTASTASAATAQAPAQPAPAVPARLFASPRARALAREKAIDVAKVPGSGPNGRIVVKDIETYLDQNEYSKIRISPAAKNMAIKEKIDILSARGTGAGGRIMVDDIKRALEEKPKPMSKMRQVIAKRLTDSFTSTPHFYVSVSADMTDLLAFRQTLKARGEVYSVTDFILESVILSLQEFPVMNSVIEGTSVRWHGNVDLGMAVGLEQGLVVPVIRDADSLGMLELHDSISTLAGKAREGRLLPDEMTGSTFTVSNMGMLNVEAFTAIINPGECGILAVSSTVNKPVVVEGEIKIRAMMNMTLSSDHRIVDGTVGAGFINAIKAKLEDIELWKSLT